MDRGSVFCVCLSVCLSVCFKSSKNAWPKWQPYSETTVESSEHSCNLLLPLLQHGWYVVALDQYIFCSNICLSVCTVSVYFACLTSGWLLHALQGSSIVSFDLVVASFLYLHASSCALGNSGGCCWGYSKARLQIRRGIHFSGTFNIILCEVMWGQ